jgi:hypothetical protein
MTQSQSATTAYAFDLRQLETGAKLGVGLVVPSHRHLTMLAEGAESAVVPQLSPEVWSEIEAWAADGDARLPARPAPMTASILAALPGVSDESAVIAHRFAAIPIPMVPQHDVVSLVDRLLPDLRSPLP